MKERHHGVRSYPDCSVVHNLFDLPISQRTHTIVDSLSLAETRRRVAAHTRAKAQAYCNRGSAATESGLFVAWERAGNNSVGKLKVVETKRSSFEDRPPSVVCGCLWLGLRYASEAAVRLGVCTTRLDYNQAKTGLLSIL